MPKKFEYHREELPGDITIKDTMARMNELGEDGWEVIPLPLGSSMPSILVLWFKREL